MTGTKEALHAQKISSKLIYPGLLDVFTGYVHIIQDFTLSRRFGNEILRLSNLVLSCLSILPFPRNYILVSPLISVRIRVIIFVFLFLKRVREKSSSDHVFLPFFPAEAFILLLSFSFRISKVRTYQQIWDKYSYFRCSLYNVMKWNPGEFRKGCVPFQKSNFCIVFFSTMLYLLDYLR